MKRKHSLLLFFLVLLIYNVFSTNAQTTTFTGIDEPPPPLKFVINAGYSFPNIAGSYIATQGTGTNSGSHNPFYFEFGYAYSQKGLLSLYLSDAQGITGNYNWRDTANIPYSYYYSVSVVSLGLSTMYHFLEDTRLSPYVGGMIGYRFININPIGNLPDVGSANISIGELAYQVYVGTSWYFVKWLGLDARAGYGNNYYAQIGLSFRFQLARDVE